MADDEQSSPEVLIKIIFVGDSGVGKTCLIERMFSNRFDVNIPATIGTDQRFKRLNIDGRAVGVSVWDTAGQDRFQSLTPFYYRGAQGVVYVFDVTRRETLDHLESKWMVDFDQYRSFDQAVRLVVGNKIDLAESTRQVSPEEGAAFARRHGCMYRETSAKTDSGGVHEGVYDALVWGMVCTILDTPGLVGARGGGGGGAEMDLSGEGRRRRGGPLGACCN